MKTNVYPNFETGMYVFINLRDIYVSLLGGNYARMLCELLYKVNGYTCIEHIYTYNTDILK